MTWIEGAVALIGVFMLAIFGFMLWQVAAFFFYDGSFERALIAAIVLAAGGSANTVVRK